MTALQEDLDFARLEAKAQLAIERNNSAAHGRHTRPPACARREHPLLQLAAVYEIQSRVVRYTS